MFEGHAGQGCWQQRVESKENPLSQPGLPRKQAIRTFAGNYPAAAVRNPLIGDVLPTPAGKTPALDGAAGHGCWEFRERSVRGVGAAHRPDGGVRGLIADPITGTPRVERLAADPYQDYAGRAACWERPLAQQEPPTAQTERSPSGVCRPRRCSSTPAAARQDTWRGPADGMAEQQVAAWQPLEEPRRGASPSSGRQRSATPPRNAAATAGIAAGAPSRRPSRSATPRGASAGRTGEASPRGFAQGGVLETLPRREASPRHAGTQSPAAQRTHRDATVGGGGLSPPPEPRELRRLGTPPRDSLRAGPHAHDLPPPNLPRSATPPPGTQRRGTPPREATQRQGTPPREALRQHRREGTPPRQHAGTPPRDSRPQRAAAVPALNLAASLDSLASSCCVSQVSHATGGDARQNSPSPVRTVIRTYHSGSQPQPRQILHWDSQRGEAGTPRQGASRGPGGRVLPRREITPPPTQQQEVSDGTIKLDTHGGRTLMLDTGQQTIRPDTLGLISDQT